MTNDKKIAVMAEDDPEVALYLKAVLTMSGFGEVHVVETGEEVLSLVQQIQQETGKLPDLLLTDHGLAGKMNGFDVEESLKKANIALPTIMVTGSAGADKDDPTRKQAQARNMLLVTKPVSLAVLKSTITMATRPQGASAHIAQVDNSDTPTGMGSV